MRIKIAMFCIPLVTKKTHKFDTVFFPIEILLSFTKTFLKNYQSMVTFFFWYSEYFHIKKLYYRYFTINNLLEHTFSVLVLVIWIITVPWFSSELWRMLQNTGDEILANFPKINLKRSQGLVITIYEQIPERKKTMLQNIWKWLYVKLKYFGKKWYIMIHHMVSVIFEKAE